MSPAVRFVAAGLIFAWASGTPVVTRAAAPVVDYVFPAGGRQGTTFAVTVGAAKGAAKIDPWPAKVWTDCPGLEFTPQEANGTFGVRVPPDAPVGPHLIRVYNAEGAAAPHVFVVGRHAEVAEQEPNDEGGKPQAVEKLPAVINGRLEKAGDLDAFAVDVEAGRWLVAELTCWRLGSPVDPALHILDPDGNEVAFGHDAYGLDPLVAYRATRTGRYVVRVVGFDDPPTVNVNFAGSKAAVYRLLLTAGPYARYAFPPGVRRGGGPATVRLFGWNLGEPSRGLPLSVDAPSAPRRAEQFLLAAPQIDNTLPLWIDDGDGTVAEVAAPPDAEAGEPPRPCTLPAVVSGRVDRPGGMSRARFTAANGQRVHLTVRPASPDVPFDPVLTVEGPASRQVARADQGEGSPRTPLEWAAPAAGAYAVTVADRNHGGGGDYAYRLELAPAAPDYRATLDAHAVRLEAGKSAEFKVTVARIGGYDGPLAAVISGLPDGVTCATAGASATAGPFTVTLSAKAGAAAANQPVGVLVVAADEARPDARPAAFDLPAGRLIPSVPNLWLTVVPSPAAATQPSTRPGAAK